MRRQCLLDCGGSPRRITDIRRDVVKALMEASESYRPCHVAKDAWEVTASARLLAAFTRVQMELLGYCPSCVTALTGETANPPTLEVLRG